MACGCLLLLLGPFIGGIVVRAGALPICRMNKKHRLWNTFAITTSRRCLFASGPYPKTHPWKARRDFHQFHSAPTGEQKHLIAVDLQRFRLFTGVPIYVDFKSIPYKDTEVLEWFRRLKQCSEWYTRFVVMFLVSF